MNDNDWINVDDRLPQEAAVVIVRTRDGGEFVGRYANSGNPTEDFIVTYPIPRGSVTHWRYPE